ncbi:MAG TPA: glycosyltransferase [Vicinamibacterales bacterium]|nr:glycosyltransferase [Vicinamibacterales bacterium]
MFNRVLILSASAGAGHVRAADALQKAFMEANAARDVRHVDALQYTNKVFRHLYSQVYLDMVNTMPEVMGWLYDYLDKPWKNERRRLALDKLNTRALVSMLQEYDPDVVVCTHFLPSEILSWLKAKRRLRCPQAIVVTDFDVHGMWLCRHYEHYFVALDETRVHLERLGIADGALSVTGIPIDPVFALTKDKAEMRARHGLDAGKTTILVSAGGFGVGRVEDLCGCLLEMRHEAQVVVLCGRNDALRKKIAARRPAGRVTITPLGFTTQVDELMAASDILLGKPGGLTTSEALAKGLVFVIVNPIPGQEERNSDHLLEEGVAIRCNNLPALAYKVDRLLDDPTRVAAMRANALRMARPHAARDIVNRLLEIHRRG